VPVAGSLAAVAAATGLIYALRPIAPVLSLGVLYVLAVMAAALVWGAAYAVPVAVVSMLAYNFFFLPPLLTLRLADGRNWTALAVYIVTALVVSNLATQAKGRAREAEQESRESALLSDAAAGLLHGQDADVLLDDVRTRRDRVLAEADSVHRLRFEAALDALVETAREHGRIDDAAPVPETEPDVEEVAPLAGPFLLRPYREWQARRALRAARRAADEELIVTRLPSPRLAWRIAELVSDDNRTTLARSLTDTVHAADERFLPSASPLDRGAVRESRAQLLELTARIADLDRPVMPRGVLLVERLLGATDSPLYARVPTARVRDEIARTLAALDRETLR
jgi:two-component system sensor histidine kinase KdpD